jgi:hypothetical protein
MGMVRVKSAGSPAGDGEPDPVVTALSLPEPPFRRRVRVQSGIHQNTGREGDLRSAHTAQHT